LSALFRINISSVHEKLGLRIESGLAGELYTPALHTAPESAAAGRGLICHELINKLPSIKYYEGIIPLWKKACNEKY